MISFIKLDARATVEHLGYWPEIFDELDPRPAKEQANDRYAHGGGWHPFDGFELDRENFAISYPGDPSFKPFAMAVLPLTEELLLFYPHAWVLVMKDNKFEISRMD